MPFSSNQIAEMNTLLLFNLKNLLDGIKVHHDAEPEKIKAAERLFQKGMVTQPDGGYLTDLGRKAAEHAEALSIMLRD